MAINHKPLKSTHKRSRKAAAREGAKARWHPKETQKHQVAGSRIINIHCLSVGIENITLHNEVCKGKCSITSEVQREGLASILEVSCDSCDVKSFIETSEKITGSEKLKARYAVNVGAVWGEIATGGGHRTLNGLMASMDIPCMSKNTFSTIETQIGKAWKKFLAQEILAAGAEEKKIASLENNLFQDVPAITVIVDGGWAKRSHKHSYNAKSGVAVIIGQKTKKLLYLVLCVQ